ncbi:Phosphoglucosamine mutase [subsurface metagenome]
MAGELIISISGMRGIVGENLTPNIAVDFGCAFGTFLKRSAADKNKLAVCIGRDSRPSGQLLKSAVTAGLCAVGIDVVDLGLVTTPGVSIMTRHLSCAGAVVITASHNPIEYNGTKLLLGGGVAPPSDLAWQIRQMYFDKDFDLVGSVNAGKIATNDQTDAVHIEKILAIVEKRSIAERKFKVVLDSVNGAGGRVTKRLLGEFGCEVVAINDEPTGLFAHTPEPLAENLIGLCEQVKANAADLGFAQDPDADRLAIVDENGSYIGEEYSLALAAKYVFGKGAGRAATNLSTSRMIDDIAAAAGCQVIRTPVGEANVVDAMIKNDCIIGGEGNGGVIDLRVGPVRDSLVGIALVLQLMAQTSLTISELASQIPEYYMKKQKLAVDKAGAQRILDEAKKAFPKARIDTSDGCRFDFADGWLHLRTSNTEPVMRVITEAKDKQTAQKYIDLVLSICERVLD